MNRARHRTPKPLEADPFASDAPTIRIESLDQEGRGIGHADGKVIFVDGALAGEQVSYASRRKKPSYEVADVGRIIESSAARVVPRCPHFGVCGGCSMQHLDSAAQVAVKQRVLEDNLQHIGKVRADRMLPAIHGPSWGYRHRARLSVRLVEKKGGVLVGFHEKRSSFVADMRECHVVPRRVSDLLIPLRTLIGSLSIARRLPQIELAIGEGEGEDRAADDQTIVLVLRILDPLLPSDADALRAFAAKHRIVFWLQPKGPDTVQPMDPASASELSYALPEFDVRIHFQPTDFTQVNAGINRVLVGRALRLLDAQPDERVADLFCGLGNFTLAIARGAREVVGIEGSVAMTLRAASNAARNGLAASTSFEAANLFEVDASFFERLGHFDRMLIDPPREGALAVVKALALQGDAAPRRIVYVSCNPSTLARDAVVLTQEGGYVLRQAGIVNMFPQTSHVESIGVFDRP